MEITDHIKETIELYINNNLKDVEKQQFETLLLQQPKLKAEVDEQLTLHKQLLEKGAYYAKRDVLKEKMKNWGKPHFKEEFVLQDDKRNNNNEEKAKSPIKPPKSNIRYLIPIAAVAAAFMLIPFLFPGNVDPQNLANSNYEIYDVSFTTKSTATDLSNAEELYNNKKWAAARDLFNRHPKNIKAQIAVANCEYQLQKYNDAIETLKPIANNKTDYSDTANWYLAMNYLQNENKNEASNTLKNITADSRFYDKAQDIIEEL